MNRVPPDATAERGASSVEYGLLIAGIAAVLVLAVYAFGGVTFSMFDNTCEEMGNHVSASCAP